MTNLKILPGILAEKHDTELMEKTVRKDVSYFPLVRHQTEAMCIDAVTRDKNMLQYVHDQSLWVCLAAVRAHPSALSMVRRQTNTLVMAALDTDIESFIHMRRPTQKQIAYVIDKDNTNSTLIQIATKQLRLSEDVVLKMVKKKGSNLVYTKHPSRGLTIMAVSLHYKALRYVIKQSVEICKAAIDNNYKALSLVRHQSNTVVDYALQKHYKALALVREPTYKQIKKAVSMNRLAITGVQFNKLTMKQTRKILKLAHVSARS